MPKEDKIICGIYAITNKVNGKKYIGLSQDIETRWAQHRAAINYNGKDYLSKPLYQAFKKYGLNNFEIEVLEECPEEMLREREIFWINEKNTFGSQGYNMTPGGDGNLARGEDNHFSILTEAEVRHIRTAYANGESRIETYRNSFEDRITWAGFCGVWRGHSWKHVMPEVFTEENKQKHIHRPLAGRVNVGANNGRSKPSEEDVLQIISLLESGEITQGEIAKTFSASRSMINQINRCLNWTHLHNYKKNITQESKTLKGGDAICL